MIYRLYIARFETIPNAVYYTNEQGNMISFLFESQNTDFQTFRTSILDGLAQLENADGVLMTSQEAIAFVETLGEA